MIAGWNAGDAAAMTRDFADDGQIVGFDGSEVSGREQIASYLAGIFANHKVASYVTLVREVRELAPDVMLLRAHAGMVPPGKSEINRATNAVQTLDRRQARRSLADRALSEHARRLARPRGRCQRADRGTAGDVDASK